MIEHEVKVEEQTLELYDLIEGEGAKNVFDPVDFQDTGSAEAFILHLPVIVFVEASVPSLEHTSFLLDTEIDSPHFLSLVDFFFGELWLVVFVSWLAIDPLHLLLIVVDFLILFVFIIGIEIIIPL
jgi:hypothetical protein